MIKGRRGPVGQALRFGARRWERVGDSDYSEPFWILLTLLNKVRNFLGLTTPRDVCGLLTIVRKS